MDGDDVDARLEAVERALADGDTDLSEVGDAAERERELAELRERVDDLESQVTELAASVQAVRGYVGNVRTVNRDVERRADAALAKVEELERTGVGHDERNRSAGATGPRDSGGTDRTRDEPESPGDIARRITGRDETTRGGPHTGDTDGRDGGRQRGGHCGPDRAPERTSADSRDGEDDGLLSGVRDAF